MTDAQLIAFINQWVYTNGNNDITAATLNPVLQAIRERQNDVTGNPDDLATTAHSNLVAAINEIFGRLSNATAGVQLYTGTGEPNTTPPASFSYADFYMMVDVDNQPVQLYQYNGFEWVISGGGGSSWSDEPKVDTAAAATENIVTLSAGQTAVLVFIEGVKIKKNLVTQVGTSVTINYETIGYETIETYYKT